MIFILIGFVLISTIVSENSVHGLECDISTMSDNFEYADAVFLGEALSKQYYTSAIYGERYDAVTQFAVTEPFKGVGQKQVKVTSSGGFEDSTLQKAWSMWSANYEE